MFNLDLETLVFRLIILVIALTVHEYAHARSADWFGDDTPRLNGRLTLNPLAHLDPIGSLLFILAGFGWAKPVPVNLYALQRRSPSAPMWVALAGPLSNLGLALLGAILFNASLLAGASLDRLLPSAFYPFMLDFMLLNLVLMLFNMIPVFPLDGEKVLVYLAPQAWAPALNTLRQYGPLILMGIVFIGPFFRVDILNWLVMEPASTILSFLIRPGLSSL